MDLPRFAVIDVETSGLDHTTDRVLQVAIATVDQGVIIDEWSSLIQVRWPWTKIGPSDIHGLSWWQLRNAPPAATVAAELAQRLDGTVVTAHNIGFDWPFIVELANTHQVVLPEVPRLCTLKLSRRLDPDRQLSHRLVDVCDRYGITIERAHDARYDARATAQILPLLLSDHGITTRSQLAQRYER
ncbi:MAG: DNA polymerase III subunit epsilon [Ilumatobacter coccineus]|uniref:DNA polymerase III subunit epsilon n=1 Tax=Ilumatobacter coccineus TaxID=467094 RepID=A0A2G6KC36_9ACTN|nr:MAG: DNA polymerase III subunit epsilon [Ilumatobacter coccineus]